MTVSNTGHTLAKASIDPETRREFKRLKEVRSLPKKLDQTSRIKV
jgi:hypothetical protein